jgi:hypothetical protein
MRPLSAGDILRHDATLMTMRNGAAQATVGST